MVKHKHISFDRIFDNINFPHARRCKMCGSPVSNECMTIIADPTEIKPPDMVIPCQSIFSIYMKTKNRKKIRRKMCVRTHEKKLSVLLEPGYNCYNCGYKFVDTHASIKERRYLDEPISIAEY